MVENFKMSMKNDNSQKELLNDCFKNDLLKYQQFDEQNFTDKISNIISHNNDENAVIDEIKALFYKQLQNDKIDFNYSKHFYKKKLLTSILDISGCVDSEFILYKYNTLDFDIDDNSVFLFFENIKKTMPHFFNTQNIDGISPEFSTCNTYIKREDFKNMKYNEKLSLFTTNKELYKNLI